jgi:hypothetical protein
MNKCFLPAKECKFVLDIVDSIQKLLQYNLPTYGGLVSALVYTNTSSNENEATLDLDGYVAIVYYLIYNDPYPLEGVKTKEQIDRINDIWIKLGLPDKQISS